MPCCFRTVYTVARITRSLSRPTVYHQVSSQLVILAGLLQTSDFSQVLAAQCSFTERVLSDDLLLKRERT